MGCPITASTDNHRSPSGLAFISVALSQTTGHRATAALRAVSGVIEMHVITGEADPLLKVVARDTADLRASSVSCSP